MNVSEYRKQIEDKIEAAQQRQQQTRTRARSALDAAGGAGYETIVSDPGKSEEERCFALNRITAERRNDPETIELVLKVLQDKTSPPSLRQAAMKNLKLLQFISPTITDYKANILEVMRSLLDPNDPLKGEALEFLAKKRDSRTQELLMKCLRDKDESLAPLAKTIQLLGYDMHSAVYPLLREVVATSNLPNTAREAVRLLSNDPDSADLLEKVFGSLDFPEEVRTASASALQALNPLKFETTAKKNVGDEKQPTGVRIVSAMALEKLSNPTSLVKDVDFQDVVERAIESKPTRELRDALHSLKTRFSGKK